MGVLSKLVITATGNLGPGKSNDQLKKWVDINGGKWLQKVGKGITHLICSKEDWKKQVDAVKQAKEWGAAIVNYDWLEDSLQRRRRLSEKRYTWEVLRAKGKKDKAIKREGKKHDAERFNKGVEIAKNDAGSGTFTSRKPHRSSFFASAMDDLRMKREAREAEAMAAREAQYAQDTKHTEPETPSDIQTSPCGLQDSTLIATTASPPPRPPSSQTKPVHSPGTSQHQSTDVSGMAFQATPLIQTSLSPGPGPKTEKLTDLYHLYMDKTGFEYNITLARTNIRLNSHARYNLRIFESNFAPHVYCTFARYVPPGGTTWSSASNIEAVSPGRTTTTTTSIATADHTNNINPEIHRLNTLITTPTPSPALPFRTLLTPQNSTFATAFHTFRQAFASLTLLTWEERLDTAFTLQKARAAHFCLEPYVWIKPARGAPLGNMPQPEALLGLAAETNARALGVGGAVGGFEIPDLGLPGVKAGIMGEGRVGAMVGREREREQERERKREVERERERGEEEEEGERKKRGDERKGGGGREGAWGRRPNFKKPLFNGVNGPPRTDAYGRYVGEGVGSGAAAAGKVSGSGMEGVRVAKRQSKWGWEFG